MSITVNPALILNAQTLLTQAQGLQAIPMNLCKLPNPQEGLRTVPIAVSPQKDSTGVYRGAVIVDLSGGAPPILSQACSMFIDATQSSSDVTIFFADTGYEFTVFARNSQLVPIISGTQLPKFYVIFGNNAVFASSDMANLQVMNQFIPEFGGGNVIKTTPLNIGVTQLGNTAPFFSQSAFYTDAITPANYNKLTAGIPGNQCFLTGINIRHAFHHSGAIETSVFLWSDDTKTTLIGQWDVWNADGNFPQSDATLIDMAGLNIVSPLTSKLNAAKFCVSIDSANAPSNGNLCVNLIGGTLVT